MSRNSELGLGSRSKENGSQELRFKYFVALAPEADKNEIQKLWLKYFLV